MYNSTGTILAKSLFDNYCSTSPIKSNVGILMKFGKPDLLDLVITAGSGDNSN